MGGVGKTTLARLLYNEKQVKNHFELKAWVCVSDEFDSFGISKVIFQSVTGVNKEFADLNLLQVDLRNHLREKRFMLVLDDVWTESCEDWETLVAPFHVCAPGSKIIMTTWKDKLLKKLGYNHLIQYLQFLPCEDALSLVALHALGVNNFDSHSSLKTHGEGIVKKCNGLPLALIALGRLLRTKKDEEEYWEEVLNSEIWSLQDVDGIVPALRLSYHDLSAHLTSSDLREERLGHKYFDELLSRSFFQYAPNNESLFVMHDLMNDLATTVASEFFIRLKNEMGKDVKKEALEKYHHMSFIREEYVPYKKFEVFKGAKRLRTFLAKPVRVVPVVESWQSFYLSNKILVDLLPELPMLRVLCLSDFCNEIKYLWESEAVASKVLVKLRYLKVLYCDNLVSLGEKDEISYRSNLLTSLKSLEVLCCNKMECCSCPDSIESLKIWSCTAIAAISLPIEKKNLKSIFWISGWPNLKSITELNCLVHVTNLRIESCECLESFPDNELPNLTSLKHLGITNCPRMDASFLCGFWPPKLLSLKIGKLNKPISEWGPQNFPTSLFHLTLYGEDVSTCSQFSHLLPSFLTSLKIDEFEELESSSVGLQHLTSLQHLHLFNCPNLMDLPEMLLPTLLSFRTKNCPNLKQRCSTGGCYWPLISDIPCIDAPLRPLS
ncbi:hypothetical protein E3N88_08044 [Mikania micrantha]|uniref:Uncharacterized protein n=1 Tax=Mikania micrantha TaxID=192012 RepID=A0A5N6PF43_9ASTR|nr:hypothetical protein E3N88_08044 [Mikania micrantha]